MRQAIECHALPRRATRGTGWLGRLWIRLFGSGDGKKLVELRHCSDHVLRDIGLLEDRRANRLLRDDVLFRL